MNKPNRSTFLVSRTFIFDAAHHLPGYDGPCKNVHGHRYELTVTLQAPQRDTGLSVDFNDMKANIEPHVKTLDHSDLNEVIKNPTTENILLWFYYKLVASLHSDWLFSITLKEGRDTQITLTRENVHNAGGLNDD